MAKPASWRDLLFPTWDYYHNAPSYHDPSVTGNPTGGVVHIVVEDGNIDDGSVQWCVEEARSVGDEAGERLARLLLNASRTQRKKLGAHYRLFAGEEAPNA